LILDDSYERVFTMNGVEQVKLGVFIIRGDNVALVGEVDDQLDKQIDLARIRADPLLPITH
jgi:U6 snRNA-associated Sm-like protein LSm8